ncbi:527_t:CDS:2 [Cetraspora pellucida]|uniref:527_t:CDS:1 n=1 Tax=Cetraspora pellucida TaxID=1433469 RepID=A0A9N9HZQ8_9GLOM|nr:527_t:CDS:2 [Cetraspora pellucida]
MNPKNNNNTLYNRQLAIFIHSQYHGGTSSASHIEDLILLTQNNHLNEILKLENTIKPIWVLLVDGGMSTLSQKLARIVLPADKYSSYLNFQDEVINQKLAKKIFKYAGKVLYDLWSQDPIFGQQDITKYTDQRAFPFDDVIFLESNDNNTNEPTWRWLENHTKICQYSIDIRKYDNTQCCTSKHCKDAADFLVLNDGFFPSVIKGNDGHYLNLLYVLKFYNIDKLPGLMITQYMRNQHPK